MAEIARQTGKWSQAGVPHKGWTCIDIEDLGEPSATCEMCETQEIRYVHHMEHSNYTGQLGCGCVCSGRMEEDYEGAQRRELVLRNASGRRKRWLSRPWRVSGKGNAYLNVDGYNIVVYEASNSIWGFRVTNRATADAIQSRRPHASEDAAKLRAFDAMLWMKDRGR
jgi:hypothetical protein